MFRPCIGGTRTQSVLVCIPTRSVGTRRKRWNQATRRFGHGRNRNQPPKQGSSQVFGNFPQTGVVPQKKGYCFETSRVVRKGRGRGGKKGRRTGRMAEIEVRPSPQANRHAVGIEGGRKTDTVRAPRLVLHLRAGRRRHVFERRAVGRRRRHPASGRQIRPGGLSGGDYRRQPVRDGRVHSGKPIFPRRNACGSRWSWYERAGCT